MYPIEDGDDPVTVEMMTGVLLGLMETEGAKTDIEGGHVVKSMEGLLLTVPQAGDDVDDDDDDDDESG